MKALRFIFIIILFTVFCTPSKAQVLEFPKHSGHIGADSARREYERIPYFTLYKDNYFIFGPPVGTKPTKDNTNIKFQISIRLKLTKNTLPWDTYLYLFYTQKVIWDILENSMPMKDLNYNPGLGLAKPIYHGDKYIGKVMLNIEHESNGRDSIFSRSWNRISFGGDIVLTKNVLLHGKFWIPWVDGQHNKDILKYVGIGQLGAEFMSNNRSFKAGMIFVKRKTWRLDFNSILEISWQPKKSNWCVFAQYYNGYGECLIDYNRFTSQFRVGIAIKPITFSDY